MKVVHIVEATFAGVGRHALDLVESQAADNELTVLYGSKRESKQFADRRKSLQNVEWIKIDVSRGLTFSDVKIMRKCRALLKRKNPDIVHGHSTVGGALARVCSPKSSKVVYTPNAIYSMNPGLSVVSRKLVGMVEVLLAKFTDRIICVSPEELEHISALGVDVEKLIIVSNGIDKPTQFTRTNVRKELGLDNKPTVGFVGRLDKQKAPIRMLEIFSAVKKSCTDAQLVVVGDGPLMAKAKEYVKCKNISSVVWLGEREGVYAMQAFDVFLLSSDYEGFPYVAIEACACGLPIVATSQSNVSQIVHDGLNGYVIDKTDVNKLSEAITSLLQNEALCQSFSKESERIAERHSCSRMCETTVGVYRNLAGSNRSAEDLVIDK